MSTNFFQLIYNHPLISEDDLNEIRNAHQKFYFCKGYVFLEEGKLANEYYLIESGLLRSFVVDYKGVEITTDFHGKNELSIEVSSFFQRVPTTENIVALTDGEVWKINFEIFQQLFHKIEGFREWGRLWMTKQLLTSKQRSIEMITKSAGERYLKLLHDSPEIIQLAPLKYIASYLGVTDTSLSRIRKETLHH